MEIYASQYGVLMEVLAKGRRLPRRRLPAIGITNQRETTILWDTEDRTAGLQRHRLAVPPYRGDL